MMLFYYAKSIWAGVEKALKILLHKEYGNQSLAILFAYIVIALPAIRINC